MDPKRDRDVLLWTRISRTKHDYRWSKIVVHGHSRVPEVFISDRTVNLDTGCVYGGRLSALELPAMKIYDVHRRSKPEPVYFKEPGSRRRSVRFAGRVPVQIAAAGRILNFETDNYSELGMCLKGGPDGCDVLVPGTRIEATLAARSEVPVTVGGEVVWFA